MPQPIRRPRRTLAALATGLAAIGVAIGSGADFTAHSVNPGNRFDAGALGIDNARESQQVFGVPWLVPGGEPSRSTITIGNSGDMPAEFSLSRADLESHDVGHDAAGPMADKLNLTVYDCGAYMAAETDPPDCEGNRRAVYEGTLGSMDRPVPLGRIWAREYHCYEFAVQLDRSAGNGYQHDWTEATFAWDAVSSDH
jgi:hypothetical protein